MFFTVWHFGGSMLFQVQQLRAQVAEAEAKLEAAVTLQEVLL